MSLTALAREVVAWEETYWGTVFRVIARIGPGSLPMSFEAVRRVEVNICADGIVVLRFPARDKGFHVVTRQRSRDTIESHISKRLQNFKDPHGNKSPTPLRVNLSGMTRGAITIMAPFAPALETYYVPDYLSARVVCPGAFVSEPKAQAVEDARTFLLARRLGAITPPGQGHDSSGAVREAVIERICQLEDSYEAALLAANCEEDMQRFLAANPFVLSQVGFIEPKVRLGERFTTDFVVDNPLGRDHTHLFVEIEDPTRRLFHKDGTQQHNELVHAIGQIDDWRIWLRDSGAYFRERRPSYRTPRFLIVIGRNGDLDDDQRRALRELNVQVADREITTYDDLLAGLRELRAQLERLGPTTSTSVNPEESQ